MRIVLASGNRGKAREIAALLQDRDVTIVTQTELGIEGAEETGTTFVDNALLKARHAAHAGGLPAIADDSGLEVDALGGAPGVYSARYAGADASDADNLAKLLDAMRGVAPSARQARFRCAMVFVRDAHDSAPVICEGVWEGRIAEVPAGANGFGYDPIFFVPGHGCTAAELDAQTKNTLSHRGQALRCLLERLSV